MVGTSSSNMAAWHSKILCKWDLQLGKSSINALKFPAMWKKSWMIRKRDSQLIILNVLESIITIHQTWACYPPVVGHSWGIWGFFVWTCDGKMIKHTLWKIESDGSPMLMDCPKEVCPLRPYPFPHILWYRKACQLKFRGKGWSLTPSPRA